MENTMLVNNDAMYDLTQPVPFGKYKGQPLSALAADVNYCQWLVAQDWFPKSQPTVYNLIVNNFVKPEDTPEHNALQARFLDKEYVKKLVRCLFSEEKMQDAIKGEIKYRRDMVRNSLAYEKSHVPDEENRDSHNKAVALGEQTLNWMDNELNNFDLDRLVRCNVTIKDGEFEYYGWDYAAKCYLTFNDISIGVFRGGDLLCEDMGLEIKPSIGDDFPTVLRQMKMQYERMPVFSVLVYDRFTGSGVTEAQMREMIESSGFRVVRFDEIDAVKL